MDTHIEITSLATNVAIRNFSPRVSLRRSGLIETQQMITQFLFSILERGHLIQTITLLRFLFGKVDILTLEEVGEAVGEAYRLTASVVAEGVESSLTASVAAAGVEKPHRYGALASVVVAAEVEASLVVVTFHHTPYLLASHLHLH